MAGTTDVESASVDGSSEQRAACRARPLCPLVFVPSDAAGWNAGYLPALDAALAAALSWWRTQLGVRPFDPEPAIAIGGRQPAAAYARNTRARIRSELAAYFPDLTVSPPASVPAVPLYVVYATLSNRPYRCSGDTIRASATAGGVPQVIVVQSSGSLDAFALGRNPLDPATGSREAQTGALAHELGHALGLPHPTEPADRASSVMWSWWRFPGCCLSAAEVRQARAAITTRGSRE